MVNIISAAFNVDRMMDACKIESSAREGFRELMSYIYSANCCIFGSSMKKYFNPQGRPGDLDILAPNEAVANALRDKIRENFTASSRIVGGYMFSDYLGRTSTRMVVKLGNRSISSARLHICHVNSDRFTWRNSPEQLATALFSRVFIRRWNQVLYYKNKTFIVQTQPREQPPRNNARPTPAPARTNANSTPRESVPSPTPVRTNAVPTPRESVPLRNEQPPVNRLEEAKNAYRAKGLVVLPLMLTRSSTAGKAPAIKGWNTKTREYDFDATNYANIGLLCGPNSGIVCIDVDVKDNGMVFFEKMIKNYGLPSGPVQETPSGGRHYIFKYDPRRMTNMGAKIKGCSFNGNRIGIDFWIQRCQFVAAPSKNYDLGKEYKWITPIKSVNACPEMPEWIYELYEKEFITEDGMISNPPTFNVVTSDSDSKEELLVSDGSECSECSNDSAVSEESDDSVVSDATTTLMEELNANKDLYPILFIASGWFLVRNATRFKTVAVIAGEIGMDALAVVGLMMVLMFLLSKNKREFLAMLL